MDLELIYADESFREQCLINEFRQFDAVVVQSSEGSDNDWMLELPVQVWQRLNIQTGQYIYIPESEWGGPVERVRYSSGDDSVRLYGTCWRGLLGRRAVCPPKGETHVVFTDCDANDLLRELLGNWQSNIFCVNEGKSGIICSGKVRYDTMLETAYSMLEVSGGRLCVVFSQGTVQLRAEKRRDLRNTTELSQEYESSIITEIKSGEYNHIIALGRGEMLSRSVVELWRLPDGSVTADGDEAIHQIESISTLIYDYSAAEDDAALRAGAKRKLLDHAGGSSMEITVNEPMSGLELTDIVSVRDNVTGMTSALQVWEKNLNITADGAVIKHILK